jgi:hypothetical protein
MAATAAVGGTAFLHVDGRALALRGNFKVMPNRIERTSIANADGSLVYTEKYVAAKVEAEISDGAGTSLQAFQSMTATTVKLELLNGKLYVLSNAFVTGTQELDAVEGKFQITFESGDCHESVRS